MIEEKVNWKTFKTTETKEIVNEYDVGFICDQLQRMRNEVKRLEDLLIQAKKVGIDPDNMVEPKLVI